MKIKLAILEKDQSYLSRIVTAFNTKYADKFEIYSFTDMTLVLSMLDEKKIDILIVSASFDIDTALLAERCAFAYLVDSFGIDHIDSHPAICKFQKIDMIYKQILNIYSENVGSVSGIKLGDNSTKIIMFSSPSGGVGTSTVAAACALHFASQDKKTLYLNLEKFGAADIYFSSEGQFGLSDVIYALKSKKANLTMKLESSIKQDANGVYFYSKPKVALDMFEITSEDIIRLISEIKLTAFYDYIIVDINFMLSKEMISIFKQSHALIWVGDKTEISSAKIDSAYQALSIMENNSASSLLNRLILIYNKVSNDKGISMENTGIKSIGEAPFYHHATPKQKIKHIYSMNMFEKIFN